MTDNEAVPAFTLDTNVLFEYWKQGVKVDAVRQLIELAAQGKIDLAVTARIREDVPDQPLAERINELPEIGVAETASVTRLGYWVLGRDMLGDNQFEGFYTRACELAMQRNHNKCPDYRDWDHLQSHFLQGRDYFVTWDRGVLCLEPELLQRFGIRVMTPEDALAKLDSDG